VPVHIEATTLLIRRRWLDVMYPAGLIGFLEEDPADRSQIRYTESDASLLAVSSLNYGLLAEIAERLEARGATCIDQEKREFVDLAFVEVEAGPAYPCPWLDLSVDDEGTTWAKAIDEPDATVEPENDDQYFRLAVENGREHWLDLASGAQVTVTNGTMRATVLSELMNREWTPHFADDDSFVHLAVDCGVLLKLPIELYTREEARQFAVIIRLNGRVPAKKRSRVNEYLSRANYGLTAGAFDLDWRDGEVTFRSAMLLGDAVLTEGCVGITIESALGTVCRYAAGLLAVMQGVKPAKAIADIDGKD
jgi:hypothetical protein